MSEYPAGPAAQVVTPYLAVKDAAEAIEFYQRAFGAVEVYRIPDDQGKVSHAEIHIYTGIVFISDEYPEINVHSAETIGNSPVMVVLDVPDVDALFNRAVAAGARVDRPLQDGGGGTLRTAKLIDPYGHRWMILTRIKAQTEPG